MVHVGLTGVCMQIKTGHMLRYGVLLFFTGPNLEPHWLRFHYTENYAKPKYRNLKLLMEKTHEVLR